MRKTLLLPLLFIAGACAAQFTFSGHIRQVQKADVVEINIPYIYGYYKENTVIIPVDSTGNFNITLPVKEKKFAYFSHGDQSAMFLLTPGKSVSLNLDSLNGPIVSFGGSAAEESRLLDKTKLGAIPFFMQGEAPKDSAALKIEYIREKVIKPWHALRDQKMEWVKESKLSAIDKALIASEIKYESILQLDYYGSYLNFSRKQRTNYTLDLYKDISPAASVSPPGLQYYYFVNNYARYLEIKSFANYESSGSKNDAPLDFIGISLDSANSLIKEKGKTFMTWLSIRKNFDKKIAEPWLSQQVQNKYRDKDLSELKTLLRELETNFPASRHFPGLQAQVKELEKLYEANLVNKNIRIYEGYEKITSIYDVINTLKGKVIYLDIWGTWCGPCKMELKYTPQLKTYFKDKDVVFLYLDMDDDAKDNQWREFIRVNGLTGIHLRKDRKTIQPFWDELIPKKEDQLGYPTYFIFDKNGKLVVPQAKRPSEEKDLYEQIETVLTME